MPVLMLEATSCISLDGSPDSGLWIMATLPYMLNLGYADFSPTLLYQEWPAEAQGSTENIQKHLLAASVPYDSRKSQIHQGQNYYIVNGARKDCSQSNECTYKNRNYWLNLKPNAANPNVYGYLHNWTYFSNQPIDGSGANTSATADGSFTWDLNPKGVQDMTPDQSVNASSTVYKINMSQSGYNKNNFDKWKAMVTSDDASYRNKIRIKIFRISQQVANTEDATVFNRGQVLTAGKEVNQVVDSNGHSIYT